MNARPLRLNGVDVPQRLTPKGGLLLNKEVLVGALGISMPADVTSYRKSAFARTTDMLHSLLRSAPSPPHWLQDALPRFTPEYRGRLWQAAHDAEDSTDPSWRELMDIVTESFRNRVKKSRVATEEEVRIMLRMSDSVGGGVIGPHDMTPKLVKSTLAKLNALQAHTTPWSEADLRARLWDYRRRAPRCLFEAEHQHPGRGMAMRFTSKQVKKSDRGGNQSVCGHLVTRMRSLTGSNWEIHAQGNVAVRRNITPPKRRCWPTERELELEYKALLPSDAAVDATEYGEQRGRREYEDVVIREKSRPNASVATVAFGCENLNRILADVHVAMENALQVYCTSIGVDRTLALQSAQLRVNGVKDRNIWHTDMDDLACLVYFGDFEGGHFQYRDTMPARVAGNAECSEIDVHALDMVIQRGQRIVHRAGPITKGVRWAYLTFWRTLPFNLKRKRV